MSCPDREERLILDDLKRRGILVPFRPEEAVGITRNGGVAIICGDGDVDIFLYHCFSLSSRPHAIKLFGGPLAMCSDFRGYDQGLASGLVKNIILGMEAKETSTVFIYFHYPCGMARKFGYDLRGTLQLAQSHGIVIPGASDIYTLFHYRSPIGIQKTYMLDVS